MRRRAALLLAPLLALAGTGLALAEAPPEHALPSKLATENLLLGVARAGDRLVAVGEWGHVVLSDDRGDSWRQAQFVPSRITLTAVTFVDARQGWAVGHDAIILHSRDGGETWKIQHAAPEEDAPLLSVWFQDARHGIAVGAFGLMLETLDGGETWERRTLSESAEEDYHLNQVLGGPEGSLFVAAEFGWIFRSRDGGDSWERLNPPYEGSFWGGMTLDGGGVLVFGMRGHVFRSDDLGETWQEIDSGMDQSLQSATRLSDGRIVLVGLGGAVLTSGDGGRTLIPAIQPDRRGIAAVAEGRNGTLLLFGETGVKRR